MRQKWTPPTPEVFQIINELPKPVARAVVWPWKASAATWNELKYSMRSVEKYLDDKECIFYILADAHPYFLSIKTNHRVKVINASIYQTAVLYGTQLADKVLWMNDDICLLKPTSWGELEKTTLRLEEITEETAMDWILNTEHNPWRKGLGRAAMSVIQKVGGPVYNFSTHTPYIYEREKAMEIFKTYGLWHKIPLETLYHNHFGTSSTELSTEKTQDLGDTNALFLNYTDSKLTIPLRSALEEMFNEVAIWEHRV